MTADAQMSRQCQCRREGGWGGERPVVGSAHCLGVMRLRWGHWGDGAAWACNQGRRGHGRLPCLPGTNSPPPANTHLPQAPGATIARAAGCGARGPARPWLGAQGDGRTDQQTSRCSRKSQRPARPQASSPRPGRSGNPARGGEEGREEGKRTRLPASGPGMRPVSAPLGTGSRTQATTQVAFDSLGGPCALPSRPPPSGPERGLRGDQLTNT